MLDEFEFLEVEEDGPIAVVTLARPPVNAVSQAMYAEIRTLFGEAAVRLPRTRVLLLRGSGRHFCAGNDLGEFGTLTATNSPGRMRLVRDAFASVYDCPVPVIALVHGTAAGTGVALVGSCDIVICGESATLSTPEVGVGVMGGAKHLRRLVPEQVMRRMYFTAAPLPAIELLPFGGIAAVVPDTALLEEGKALGSRIAKHSSVALRHAKASLNQIESMDLKAGYEFEQSMTARLAQHPDSSEARAAVLEKRAPHYSET